MPLAALLCPGSSLSPLPLPPAPRMHPVQQSTEGSTASTTDGGSHPHRGASNATALRHWQTALTKLTAVRTMSERQRSKSRSRGLRGNRMSRLMMALPDSAPSSDNEGDAGPSGRQHSMTADDVAVVNGVARSANASTSGAAACGHEGVREASIASVASSLMPESPFLSFTSAPDPRHALDEETASAVARRMASFTSPSRRCNVQVCWHADG